MCGDTKVRVGLDRLDAAIVEVGAADTKKFPIFDYKTGKPVFVQRDGFARKETLREKWLKKGWRLGIAPVTEYTEGHGTSQKAFLVSKDKGLYAIYKEVSPGLTLMKFVTRSSQNDTEKKIHLRWPIEGSLLK